MKKKEKDEKFHNNDDMFFIPKEYINAIDNAYEKLQKAQWELNKIAAEMKETINNKN